MVRDTIRKALESLATQAERGEWLDNAGQRYLYTLAADGHAAEFLMWANGQLRLPGVPDDYFLWGGDPAQREEPDRCAGALKEQTDSITNLILEIA